MTFSYLKAERKYLMKLEMLLTYFTTRINDEKKLKTNNKL